MVLIQPSENESDKRAARPPFVLVSFHRISDKLSLIASVKSSTLIVQSAKTTEKLRLWIRKIRVNHLLYAYNRWQNCFYFRSFRQILYSKWACKMPRLGWTLTHVDRTRNSFNRRSGNMSQIALPTFETALKTRGHPSHICPQGRNCTHFASSMLIHVVPLGDQIFPSHRQSALPSPLWSDRKGYNLPTQLPFLNVFGIPLLLLSWKESFKSWYGKQSQRK